jgi:hypothetical protein
VVVDASFDGRAEGEVEGDCWGGRRAEGEVSLMFLFWIVGEWFCCLNIWGKVELF